MKTGILPSIQVGLDVFFAIFGSWTSSLAAHPGKILALCVGERSAWNWVLLVPGFHRKESLLICRCVGSFT